MTEARFIALEGIEGAGKSSHLPRIAAWLQAQGVTVQTTREPGGTEIGEAIRRILLTPTAHPMAAETEALLMFAARAQHVAERIRPALEAGRWVISDRFVDASYAYQGVARGLGRDRIERLAQWTLQGFAPDKVLLFDLSAEESARRVACRREAQDRFERETFEFFERVRDAYLMRARREPGRYYIIDASQPVEQVEAQWKQALKPLLP